MPDPVADGARAAARRLGLTADVESALQARRPDQYLDPVSLASLIVSAAALAWTVYQDLRKKTDTPSPDVVSRTVRTELRRSRTLTTRDEEVITLTVQETLTAMSGTQDSPGRTSSPARSSGGYDHGMARLRRTPPHELDPEARALYDKITSGPRGRFMVDAEGGLTGPFNAMLLSPALGDPLQELGAAVRYRSTLSDRARELAILVVAGHQDSAFEQAAHEPIARELGFTEEQLRALRDGSPPALDDPGEAAVLRVVRALVTKGDLDEEEYAVLGEREVFELTTLVGYYSTLALQLRVFRV
ncbi:carboxymuconolactone decarboxylase family protein [Nonomuraea gerenzanensis]|uniref:Carboxymuconolactone decarboxylase-like domain-containing protein n=1 Tax=Nonomuraea gerenzanensis TaxID=93944 RepID=A0A1M4E1W4_9ACTN|nr:carboxymuconolactone decarboxylase family protein [Nonomuraea gerenzanensis]UBU15049.1 carboxymuconolactone decarboxylase family protein [Nonomuraea gerenzanensis]SBO92792.1 hypothetical protein BN4615_P2306 [Nonomuraea gerenzanensis]